MIRRKECGAISGVGISWNVSPVERLSYQSEDPPSGFQRNDG